MKIRKLVIILVVLGFSNSIQAQNPLYEFGFRFEAYSLKPATGRVLELLSAIAGSASSFLPRRVQ